MPKADGGHAFPSSNAAYGNGMTLRQWYAGNAPDSVTKIVDHMTLNDARKYLRIDIEKWSIAVKLQIIAKLQFEYADAMIAEGEKDR